MSKEKEYEKIFGGLIFMGAMFVLAGVLLGIFTAKANNVCNKRCGIIEHKVIDWECYCATEQGWDRHEEAD